MSLLRHWKTLLALGVVFLAGTLFGVVGTVRHIQREYRAKMDETTWTPRTLTWLRDAASLSPSQEEQLRPIVEQAIAQMKELREESEAKRKSIIHELLLAVSLQLPQPQREQLARTAKAAAEKPSPWGSPLVPQASSSGK